MNSINTKLLCCPLTHQSLALRGGELVSDDGLLKYKISEDGIPLFAENFLSSAADQQQKHYDRVAKSYNENLNYPHTIVYTDYLDQKFLEEVQLEGVQSVAEICCGHGELLSLRGFENIRGVGVDISTNMLSYALKKHAHANNFSFVQGDATSLPIQTGAVDQVYMFGGIHHVPDRNKLFSEIYRILKPGGKFYFREPVSDFFIWRWIRLFIYLASPALDSRNERPLLWGETVPLLYQKGFSAVSWKTYGFFGFCFFMNSDILVFNRYFRFIPGIKKITKFAAYVDDIFSKVSFLRRSGLQVIGVAEKSR